MLPTQLRTVKREEGRPRYKRFFMRIGILFEAIARLIFHK